MAFLLKTLQVFTISILTRLITLSLEEFCPTPCSQYTTYNNLYNKGKEEEEEETDSQRGVYVVQNNSMVGQNKNTLLRDEKIAIITHAIKQIMADNQKITVRKIQELSGVAKATVEKHYKLILSQISQDNVVEEQTDATESKVADSASIEDKLTHKRMRLEERFKSRVSDRMLIADLRNVLGDKTINKIPVSDRFNLIQGINYASFDKFWENLQNYKSNFV